MRVDHVGVSWILLLLSVPAFASAQPTGKIQGQLQGCMGCHGVPDHRVPGDDLWIGRIATTACVQPPGEPSQALRTQMMAFLRGDQCDRPRVVQTERAPRSGEGRVRLHHGRTTVLLIPADEGKSPIRVIWPTEKGGLRSVPAGDYRVRNYRIERLDREGVVWQVWGSGARGRTLKVEAGATTELPMDPRVTVKISSRSRKGGLQLGVQVLGDSGQGLTVIRGQERVPANYELRRGEVVLARGDLDYG